MDGSGSLKTGETSEPKENVTSPDDVIKQIGGCGRFQITLSVLIHLMKTVVAWSLLCQVFVLYTPKWRCATTYDSYRNGTRDPMFENGTSAMDNDTFTWNKQCVTYSDSACQHFQYELRPKTLVSKLNLVCDLAWVPATIMSMQMAGLCVGNLLAGQMADIFGRKKPLMFSMLMLFTFNMISAFSVNWVMFAVSRVFAGIGSAFFLSIQYNLMSEYTLSKWRSVIIGFPSYPLQACLFAFFAWLIEDWQIMTLITAAMSVMFMFSWCIIPESFRWHIGHDRYAEAETLVRRIAKFNKCPQPTNGHLLSSVTKEEMNPDTRKYTVLDMFRTRELLKKTLCLMISWFTVGFCMYGIGFGIQKLSGSIYLNLFLFNIASIPSKLLTIFFQNKFGRKAAKVIALSVCGIGGLAAGVVQYIDIDEDQRGLYTNYLALAANVGVNMLWGPLQTLTVEIYPTVIRGLGFGFLSTMSRVGAIIGPHFVYLNDLIPGLLYFAVALLCLMSTCATLCLPETRDSYLQDKIKDEAPSGGGNKSAVV